MRFPIEGTGLPAAITANGPSFFDLRGERI